MGGRFERVERKELLRSGTEFGMLSENEKAYQRRSEMGWILQIILCQTHPTSISLLTH
ncbi:hypothetical protein TSAR_007191 [Trichomalopsis sarcophagae]|uniref:Uncharacterized protein n=1 Tax=Trichomalopsis sarcophagae TaxID=543379 RepID=A0A232EQS3_9HYME|nr:hypothetical protein TSAR_007191 [Trichomalopsis sarcophagae]